MKLLKYFRKYTCLGLHCAVLTKPWCFIHQHIIYIISYHNTETYNSGKSKVTWLAWKRFSNMRISPHLSCWPRWLSSIHVSGDSMCIVMDFAAKWPGPTWKAHCVPRGAAHEGYTRQRHGARAAGGAGQCTRRAASGRSTSAECGSVLPLRGSKQGMF